MAQRRTPSSSRIKKHKVGQLLEDWISGLPDEILVYILSLLAMKEAGRTSLLSKKWKYMWTYIPCLNFDASQILNELQLGTKLLKVERPMYRSWVNQVVKSYKGPVIDEFRVRFDLDKSCRNQIDMWVKFAMEKRVKRLELDLSNYWEVGAQNRCYAFPDMFSSFTSLTSLRLVCVNISGKVLEYFLFNCPLLEFLSVVGSSHLVNLKVYGPSLNLKRLEISYCFDVTNIEIAAPNLVSFKYFGPNISMSFNNIPKLVEIDIGGGYCAYLLNNFVELSSYFSQLERLTLQMYKIEKSIKHVKFPLFTKLKELELMVTAHDDESLLGFSSLIEASPLLYRFALQLDWREPDIKRKRPKTAACPHYNLKVVEIVGFVGKTIDVELLVYLTESAVALEKIIFDPRSPLQIGSPWEFEDSNRKRAARNRAKQLGKKLSPGADLVIL